MDALHPMTIDKIVDPDHPEKKPAKRHRLPLSEPRKPDRQSAGHGSFGQSRQSGDVNRDVSGQRLGQPARQTAGQDRTGPCGQSAWGGGSLRDATWPTKLAKKWLWRLWRTLAQPQSILLKVILQSFGNFVIFFNRYMIHL